jgi:hypothetical protein
MNEKDIKNEVLENEKSEESVREFMSDDFELDPLSSSETLKKTFSVETKAASEKESILSNPPKPSILSETEEEKLKDPIFAELAIPKLPELQKENRARLQMQSPHRLYFYWSIKNNPYQTLQKIFGSKTGSYQLVVKLINQKTEQEEIHPVEAEGNWWFNVEPDSSYRAEIGFYAPNRPFIRLIFSNTVETPRKSPSPRVATEADWAVSALEFAEVLNFTGFVRDAYEVAITGDNWQSAEIATQNAFRKLFGSANFGFNAEEVRFALLALAYGVPLEDLRHNISESLYIFLQENILQLSAEQTMSALKENFDILDEEIIEEDTPGAFVFGASLVNFPKRLSKRAVPKTLLPNDTPKLIPRLSPISSFSLGN